VAGDADGVVAELPLPEPRVAFANAPYMLNSTVSWNPLLNGFSGFVPGSYQQHYDALRGFPDARSLSALKAFGVRYVFVHTDLMNAEAVKGLEHTRTLEQIAADGAVILYRVNGV